MSYRIAVLGLAGSVDSASPAIGGAMWIKAADIDAHEGRGEADLTSEPDDALLFATIEEAVEFWKRPSTVRPTREDGEANRPLTAFTVAIEPTEGAT